METTARNDSALSENRHDNRADASDGNVTYFHYQSIMCQITPDTTIAAITSNWWINYAHNSPVFTVGNEWGKIRKLARNYSALAAADDSIPSNPTFRHSAPIGTNPFKRRKHTKFLILHRGEEFLFLLPRLSFSLQNILF